MSRQVAARAFVTLLMVVGCLQPGEAYLRLSFVDDGNRIAISWPERRIPYFVSDRPVPGVTTDAFETTVQRAADSWHASPGSNITFQYLGRTAARPLELDGRNTVGFLTRIDLAGVLGVTATISDVVTGDIVEADVFFNAAYDWSVASAGDDGRFDLESVALHELGHMLGLNHSALGYFDAKAGAARVAAAEAVMFPFAFDPGNIAGRQLKADDIAGVAEIYPESDHRANTAAIRARLQLDGRNVFGAHVMTFNPLTGTMVAGFVLENGEAMITGLDPGPYVLRVEPVDDDNVGSYFEEPPTVDLAFKNKFVDRLVYVQRGGTAGPVQIALEAK